MKCSAMWMLGSASPGSDDDRLAEEEEEEESLCVAEGACTGTDDAEDEEAGAE